MNTLGIEAMWDVVYAIRWVLVFGLIVFLAATAVAQSRRADEAEDLAADWMEWAEQLEQDLADERAQHPQVVALPPRKDTEASHG